MARRDSESDIASLVFRNLDSELAKLSDALRDSHTGAPADRFEASERVILGLESGLAVTSLKRQCFLWEGCIDDTRRYLSAVDCILQLIEDRELLADGEMGERVDGVVQKAMSRLEDEFRHVMNRSVVPLDGEQLFQRLSISMRRISLSFGSDGASEDFDSSVDEDRDSSSEERRGSLGEDLCIELMNADSIVDLREIAERMIRAGYEKECCQVYTTARLEALYQCLTELGVEKLSIDEVQRLEWSVLEEKMKKWVQTLKTVVRFLLAAEKQLCSQIFCGFEQTRDACFTETAKECVMQLLNFGEAVVIVPRSPEKMFQILNMYEVLAEVREGLRELFPDDLGGFVFTEVEDLLVGLGEAVKGTFVDFENAVLTDSAQQQVTHFGDVHPMTRYVMNYCQYLVDYSNTLNLLFKDNTVGSCHLENDGGIPLQIDNTSPLGRRLLSVISSLESNLHNKSKFYTDDAIRYVFLMNNILYIVKKVKDSELGKLLGDHWVRRRRSQVREHSICYLRASWIKVLAFLKDDGIFGSGSLKNISKVALKEKFKNFNAAFEEIYKCQSAWKVPDPQLRDELRILISERILPAYRAFVGRFKMHIESVRHSSKYMKYTPDDIENYLLDFFEGSPKDLLYPKKH